MAKFVGKSLPVNRALFALFMSARLSEQSDHGMSTIVENYGRESVLLSSEMTMVTFPLNYVRDDVLARKRLKATLTSGQNAGIRGEGVGDGRFFGFGERNAPSRAFLGHGENAGAEIAFRLNSCVYPEKNPWTVTVL